MAENSSSAERLTALTAQVAASYVSRHDVAVADLPQLIATIYQSLARAGQTGSNDSRREPAVPVRRSISADFIVCLEDGKKLKKIGAPVWIHRSSPIG